MPDANHIFPVLPLIVGLGSNQSYPVNSPGEIFADMFSAWLYDTWEVDDGGLTGVAKAKK